MYVEDTVSNKQRKEGFISKLGWGNFLHIWRKKSYFILCAKINLSGLKFKDKIKTINHTKRYNIVNVINHWTVHIKIFEMANFVIYILTYTPLILSSIYVGGGKNV